MRDKTKCLQIRAHDNLSKKLKPIGGAGDMEPMSEVEHVEVEDISGIDGLISLGLSLHFCRLWASLSRSR